jgi:hypothetical protein
MNYYSWLDTYTHVKPQALEKLRKATMKSSFSFADFGIFCEFAASATICNEGHGFQPKVSFLDHFPPGASTYCLKVVHILLLSSFGVTIPHKMSPLFGNFVLVPFISVPPFGFGCCWPFVASSCRPHKNNFAVLKQTALTGSHEHVDKLLSPP